MAKISVLVTAVNGDLGQSVVKALRLGQRVYEIHGCDSSRDGIGTLFVDSMYKVPKATEKEYIEDIEFVCGKEEIDIVIPCCEPEIEVLSKVYPELPNGTKIACQNEEFYSIFSDKLRCYISLEELVDIVPFIDGAYWSTYPSDFCSFDPIVIKERRGSGSKGTRVFYSLITARERLEDYSSPVIQEFISAEFGEFSVGVFVDNDDIRLVSFKRNLFPWGGPSMYAEVDQDNEVLDYCRKIVEYIKPAGSINIQVRKSSKGVRLLEINPRFSSLASARAIAGFNDVEWSIEQTLGLPIEDYHGYDNIKFQRYLGEVVDFGKGFEVVNSWLPK